MVGKTNPEDEAVSYDFSFWCHISVVLSDVNIFVLCLTRFALLSVNLDEALKHWVFFKTGGG